MINLRAGPVMAWTMRQEWAVLRYSNAPLAEPKRSTDEPGADWRRSAGRPGGFGEAELRPPAELFRHSAPATGGIGLAFIAGTFAHRLRLWPLVVYLLAGVEIGPFTPGYVADQNLAH